MENLITTRTPRTRTRTTLVALEDPFPGQKKFCIVLRAALTTKKVKCSHALVVIIYLRSSKCTKCHFTHL